MANITLGTLRDYWKRVYDAITGPPGSAAPTYAMQVGGTDGTNLRTLKTDASGNLSVLLNGSVVPDNQPVPIKVIGASYQSAISRAIYAATTSASISVPVGVRGCLLVAKVYAVTGTNPSLTVNLRAQPYATIATADVSLDSSAITSAPNGFYGYWYPGASLGAATAISPYECKVAALPVVADKMYVRFLISGTFDTDEGFDAAAWIYWIP